MTEMKCLSCLFLLVVTLLGCTATDKSSPPDAAEAANSLRYLKEVQWPKAYREQDTVLLDNILDDRFQMVDASGNWSDKTGELEWIKQHAMSHDSFRYEIKRLDVLENGTAVVAGTGHIINDGQESLYESTNILIWRGGQWKAISSHVSGIR